MDTSTINLLKQGDERAFNKVFAACHERVYRYAFTFAKDEDAAKELVHEVFVQLWLNREKLDENIPIYSCLFAKAKWLAIEAYRKRLVAQKYEKELEAFQPLNTSATENVVSWKELNQVVTQAIGELPLQQQRIFEMSRVEGLSYEEIGEQLHISRNTVKYHLVNALKAIRGRLEAQDLILSIPIILALLGKN